ncbi:hypothetical protein REPUB_Repub06bG0020600 [Reevesia pubescens]
MKKLTLRPSTSPLGHHQLPLSGLTFAVKDIFDVDGYVTGFGNPDWERTHSAATSTAPAVLDILRAGVTCVGKTIMDEMAYWNPCAPDRVPGGSSSGSAVAVGTDTGACVRLPASYCGILGFRSSHDVVFTVGVLPLAQSFVTVVGHVLLHLPNMDPIRPTKIIIPEDCFRLSTVPSERTAQILVKAVEKLFGGQHVKHLAIGDYVKEKVPSLQHFMDEENDDQEYNIPSLEALSSAMRLLQRYELKNNHAEWVTKKNPDLGPGISEQDHGILALPTAQEGPPKLQTDPAMLAILRARAFSLLSIAGLSGFCQVSIPLEMHNNIPVSISLLAKHGSDAFLLNLVGALYDTLQEEIAVLRE